MQNGLKEEDALLPLFLNLALEYDIWNVPAIVGGDWYWMGHLSFQSMLMT